MEFQSAELCQDPFPGMLLVLVLAVNSLLQFKYLARVHFRHTLTYTATCFPQAIMFKSHKKNDRNKAVNMASELSAAF